MCDRNFAMPTTRSKRKASEISQENVEQMANVAAGEEKDCPGTVKKAKVASKNKYGIHPDSTVREVVEAVKQILIEVCVCACPIALYCILLQNRLLFISLCNSKKMLSLFTRRSICVCYARTDISFTSISLLFSWR